MEDLIIELESPTKSFSNHLQKGNSRIIFSGIFGAGKTTFLRNFFKENKQYNAIHLFPVNYSIASNEDVFEYLKYDIFYELLGYPDLFSTDDLKKYSSKYEFIVNNIDKILETFLLCIPKIGRQLGAISNNVYDLWKGFNEAREGSEIDKLMFFHKKMESRLGSIYENDFYTQLIADSLQKLEEESSCENVLIIDDLDRIDPDHIFRLLNVFSAHFDSSKKSYENKFGFHKIVVVLDINNVRSIFENRYGKEVDFEGYIDKFYTSEVFHYNNLKAVLDKVTKLFESVNLKLRGRAFTNDDYFAGTYVIVLIRILLKSGKVNLRTLLKSLNLEYDETADRTQPEFQFVINFLSFLIGDKMSLYKKLKQLKPADFIYRISDEHLMIFFEILLNSFYRDKTPRKHGSNYIHPIKNKKGEEIKKLEFDWRASGDKSICSFKTRIRFNSGDHYYLFINALDDLFLLNKV